jgi:hypothetical protein
MNGINYLGENEMRKYSFLIVFLGLALIAAMLPQPRMAAAQDIKTATPTGGIIGEPPVANGGSADRPVVVIESYYLNKDTIRVGDSFTLYIALKNQGQQTASNLILNMINESFLPQDNGGVVTVGSLVPGQDQTITHAFLVSSSLFGQTVGTIPAKLSYTGPDGTQYSESFAITLQLVVYSGAFWTQTPTATATTAPVVRPQLVVSSYSSSVDPLQPGTLFDLEIKTRNLGNAEARAVTMVLGGGVQPDTSGTPAPGGTSGGSSDLSTFAPIGSSNLFYLGDVAAGAEVNADMHLIVNVSANPGAYTLKLSFVYTDSKGNRLVDDQIITLLIYQLPQVETSFYRDPGPLFVGQANQLPIQVVNLGRKSTVLGNLKVSSPVGEVSNNVSLVGPLDPGGSFTLDAMYIPQQAGEQDLELVIGYTDDFNQVRQVTSTIKVTVLESAQPQPELTPGAPGTDGGPGNIPAPLEETFMDKAVRFVKGLLGLGSGAPQSTNLPSEGVVTPLPSDGKVPSGGKPLKSP